MSQHSAIIRSCAATNAAYMLETPAGTAGYPAVVNLYAKIAAESLVLAAAWDEGGSCPPHDPAVDAFWCGVAHWSATFFHDVIQWWVERRRSSTDIEPVGALGKAKASDLLDAREVFYRPHQEFATWLRFAERPTYRIRPRAIDSPARIILEHDAAWTIGVIKLTARWGLVRHLKDLPALWQSVALVRRLRSFPNDAALTYLHSDLEFLERLFSNFPFSAEARAVLHVFLERARHEMERTVARLDQHDTMRHKG